MSARTDMEGSANFNNTASGNTEDGKINYSISTASNTGDYGDLNQISGYGSWSSPYGPCQSLPLLAMTAANNIPPTIAAAWWFTLAA